MAQKTALITGITGQDGGYLATYLLDLGYRVVGLTRRNLTESRARIGTGGAHVDLVSGDLLDQGSLLAAIDETQPDEIYNLAAQTFVPASWRQPILTAEVTALGFTRLLEAVRIVRPAARVFQASSSEMFGLAAHAPQNERTPFRPRSPYGSAKLHAHWAAAHYRDCYGLFIAAGILFNHESPRRGHEFVTRKITHGVATIAAGQATKLSLGNLDARRDWGYAPDFVRAMHAMLQLAEPVELVVATGEAHSVREFCELAFAAAGLAWQNHVVLDPALLRPAEIMTLIGDAAEARALLGWRPSVSFSELVHEMVEADLARVHRDSRSTVDAALIDQAAP